MTAVVIVHGIGNAPPGTLLRKTVRSLVSVANDSGHHAVVSGADHAGKPPAATIEIGSDRVEVIEASWNELVPPSTFRAAALWFSVVAPFTVIGLIRAIPRRSRELMKSSRLTAVLWTVGAGLIRVVVGGLLFPLWFLPALLAISVTALVPSAQGKALLGQVQKALSSTLGDSYVFVDDPVARATIVDHVRSCINDATKAHTKVIVVGHSQGAHIATAALAGADNQSRIQLMTWGSGFRKLRELERITAAQPVTAVQAAGPVLALPLAVLILLWADGAWALLVFGLIALALLWRWIGRIGASYQLTESDVVDALPGSIPWTDYWSSHDLVPDGGLHSARVTSVAVHNTGTALGDHTRYHTNPHVLVPLLAAVSTNFARGERKRSRPTPVRAQWHLSANLVAATVAVLALGQLAFRGGWDAVGYLIVAGPYVLWSRLELMWRLRHRRQLQRKPAKTLTERWLKDSHESVSLHRLTIPMTIMAIAAAFFNLEGPATVTQGTAIGISGGWGSGGVLAASAVLYALTVAAYLVLRAIWRPNGKSPSQ